jgi:acetolactate synthase-1/2/3 large subunit
MFSLSRPSLDFVALARSMGMSAGRATSADELVAELRLAFAERGPHLIEAIVPPIV